MIWADLAYRIISRTEVRQFCANISHAGGSCGILGKSHLIAVISVVVPYCYDRRKSISSGAVLKHIAEYCSYPVPASREAAKPPGIHRQGRDTQNNTRPATVTLR